MSAWKVRPLSPCCLAQSLTYTFNSVSHPTVPAAAFKAPRDIDAGGVHVTVMSTDLTLVDI